MTLAAWATLIAVWFVAVASPGPDFVAVLRSGAARGRRDALLVGAGVVSGIACRMVLALTGLSVLIATHAGLYAALRYAGAAFLVAYGLWILWHARRAGSPGPTTDRPTAATPRSGFAAWRLGLLTNLANPKAVVFFGALLASLLPANPSWAVRGEVLVAMLVLAYAWFALVAFVAGSRRITDAYARMTRRIDAVLGGVFVVLGGALLTH